MGRMFVKKTLCLFEVELKHMQLPDCAARLAVDYRVLDAAAWRGQANTNHITDRHLFQARLERGEQFWTAQHDGTIVAYCWATCEPVEIGEIRRVIVHETYLEQVAREFPQLKERIVAAPSAAA